MRYAGHLPSWKHTHSTDKASALLVTVATAGLVAVVLAPGPEGSSGLGFAGTGAPAARTITASSATAPLLLPDFALRVVSADATGAQAAVRVRIRNVGTTQAALPSSQLRLSIGGRILRPASSAAGRLPSGGVVTWTVPFDLDKPAKRSISGGAASAKLEVLPRSTPEGRVAGEVPIDLNA